MREPFRVGGTELPDNILLLVKVTTLAMIFTGQVKQFSYHFLPFLRFFDRMGPPAVYHWTLVAVFMVAATALFFNRSVRVCCLVLGFTVLISLLSSRTYFQNGRTFCACIFLLAAMCQRGEKPWPIRLQVILVYFGAALNKLLEPDWRSGQFFAFWFGQIHQPGLWAHMTTFFPAMPLAKFMCWAAISTELVLFVGFLIPRFYGWTIWLGVAYHTALLVLMNSTFGVFYFAMPMAYVAFVDWPEPPVLVLYDGDCGFCEATRRWFSRLDLEGRFSWIPFQSTAEHHGVSEQQLQEKVHLFIGDRVASGFKAFKLMLLYNPLVYYVFVVIMAREPHSFRYARWLGLVALLLFTPFLEPVGEFIYNKIARNRHRLTGSSCSRAA
jgi:predicted DCC family thiol-disulfide oxidoreductase YuxK